MWFNFGLDFAEEMVGSKKYQSLMHSKREATATCIQNVLGRNALSLASHNAIKHVRKSKISAILKRYNAVGAVGYAHVFDDNVLSSCEFFKPRRCFKIRFRVSNVNCEDDAASCIREVAIKFSDQDRDGLFDLILYTGRTFLARDSKDFLELLNIDGNDKEIQQLCRKNPYTYRAFADGLRRSPTSFADLTYYSQICYRFSKQKKEKFAIKFRLVPSCKTGVYGENGKFSESQQVEESGMLSKQEQKNLWSRLRDSDDRVDPCYLKHEFKRRLWEDEPISFILEVQMRPLEGDYYDTCNPQLIWDEKECPWTRVMVLELTTHMTSLAIAKTTFNISDSPKGLGFPDASGLQDPFSLQKVMMSVYTEIERRGVSQICLPAKNPKDDGVTTGSYVITLCTEPLNENKQVPYVEVHVTLWGWRCRSCALVLNLDNRLNCQTREKNFRVNQHRVSIESVGELINITIDVYYRHLTESWYLRDVEVYDESQRKLWTFPCYEVVEGSVTLEPGDVRLVHKQMSEVSKKERLFQLNNRQLEYTWNDDGASSAESERKELIRMPGHVRPPDQAEKLPNRHRTRAVKYRGIRWEVDPKMIEFFREFHSSIMTHNNFLTRKLKAKMNKSKTLKSNRKANKRILHDERHETDGRGMMRRRPKLARLPSHDLHVFSGNQSRFSKNMIYNNLLKNTNHYNNVVSNLDGKQEAGRPPKIRFKSPSMSMVETGLQKDVYNQDFSISEVDGTEIESKLPEGSLGEMCRTVLNDMDFGRHFLIGSNPTVIKRCHKLPSNFPVRSDIIHWFLERSRNLEEEMEAGYVYLADYKILSGLPTLHHEADHRFIAAPMVLLYVKESGDLVPIAIQLEQVPKPDNPVWTPCSTPESWMLAKLWVRCCDFNHQFAVSHLFNCHLLMEPFLIATMRCLPTNHPCHKILMPYFRYMLVSNSMIRRHVLSENGSVDRHTSLGRNGFQKLMERHWKRFNFEQLNPIKDAERRGVSDVKLLPGYLYRDDSQRIFNSIHKCCSELISVHYPSFEDYKRDLELRSWLLELADFGFPGQLATCPYSSSLQLIPSAPPLSPPKTEFNFEGLGVQPSVSNGPEGSDGGHLYPFKDLEAEKFEPDTNLANNLVTSSNDYENEREEEEDDNGWDEVDYSTKSLTKDQHKSGSGKKKRLTRGRNMQMLRAAKPEELAEILATVIFTITCQHSVTHSDALDLFGFVPDVPAMMRKSSSATNFYNVDGNVLTHTLPDQYPEAYYASLLFIMNAYKPDQNVLGEMDEVYFVDDESCLILKRFKKDMRMLTTEHRARNLKCGIRYEALVPQYIPASPEPLPYIPRDVLEKSSRHLGPTMTVNLFLEQMTLGTVSPFVLEQCLTFYKTLGGRSTRGLLDESYQEDAMRGRNQKPKQVRKDVNDNDGGDDSRPYDDVDGRLNAAVPSAAGFHRGFTASERRKEFVRARVMSSNY